MTTPPAAILRLLARTGTVHPNRYTGRKRGPDHAAALSAYLTEKGIPHITGNDAPRKGHAGKYVTLKQS